MQSDTTTRVMLASILVCLVLLIVLNLREGPAAAPPPLPAQPVQAPVAQVPAPAETYRNQRGRGLTNADLVALTRSVTNENLPVDMRVWAALQLEAVRHPDAARALIQTLDAEEEVLTTAALQALAGHDDPRVREAIQRGLEHEDESVRAIAQYVLDSLEKPSRRNP